jgi:fructokinase
MRIGIDLGGTKIECAALDSDGSIIFRRRVATPRHDYDATLVAISLLVSDCEQETGRRGTVGIGHPGATSPATGFIKNANSTWLNGRPLREDLERVLGRPLRLANDANCFALSEANPNGGTAGGAAAGARVVFGVILGTGTGGGLVVEGRVLTGLNAVAGEWGHNPLPWPRPEELPGPACYCGRRGCIETFLSGPGLARDFRAGEPRADRAAVPDRGTDLPHPLGSVGTPDAPGTPVGADPSLDAPGTLAGADLSLDARAVVQLAGSGNALADAALHRYVDRMARALASVINLLDPDVIVLGGGMSSLDRLYDDVPRLWGPRVFSDRVETPLRRAVHGDSSGVRGAAWLWEEPGAPDDP